jgi:hypothetical protein
VLCVGTHRSRQPRQPLSNPFSTVNPGEAPTEPPHPVAHPWGAERRPPAMVAMAAMRLAGWARDVRAGGTRIPVHLAHAASPGGEPNDRLVRSVNYLIVLSPAGGSWLGGCTYVTHTHTDTPHRRTRKQHIMHEGRSGAGKCGSRKSGLGSLMPPKRDNSARPAAR